MSENLSVHIKTLGCKVNTFDSHALENQFVARGYCLQSDHKNAAVTVINTCSVTANAEKEARYLARRIKRENPDTRLIFTGCYAQTDSAAIVQIEEVDLVVPNEIKHKLVDVVSANEFLNSNSKIPLNIDPVSENRQSHFKSSVTLFDAANSSQTRAFVKIQDGCNGFCSYCLIPYARGASRSVEESPVVTEITRLVNSGVKEVVLTGIHIGDYGEDLSAPTSFAELLKKIFAIPGLERLRISSMEPAEINPAFLDVLEANRDRFCDHMHLPLQSGSDPILKKMRRTYDTARYYETIVELRRRFPNINIGADVIPGFPGETQEDHEATIAFIKKCNLNYLHVFPYSKRPNTAAAKMPGHLPPEIVKQRSAELRQLSETLSFNYARQFIGTNCDVLFEKDTDEQGRAKGLTKNYLTIVSSRTEELTRPGSIGTFRLKGFVNDKDLLGVPVH